ncbi:hypothetical protein Dimus_034034 [Dionaea muscipula]
MGSFCRLSYPQISVEIGSHGPQCKIVLDQKSVHSTRGFCTGFSSHHVQDVGANLSSNWSFHGGRGGITFRPKVQKKLILVNKSSRICASWLVSSQIASNVFTFGTVAVLPFYTLMIAAPKADLTKKCMESNVPYIILGLVYAYILYLSWTPDTLGFMFASKYWLPELPGIAKMFTSEMTLASAWIHLLTVDLFAARSKSFPLSINFLLRRGNNVMHSPSTVTVGGEGLRQHETLLVHGIRAVCLICLLFYPGMFTVMALRTELRHGIRFPSACFSAL